MISKAHSQQRKKGLTKREEFAMAAMQGLLAGAMTDYKYHFTDLPKEAVSMADAVLEELENTNERD